MSDTPRATPEKRSSFRYFMTQQTRWSDNDQYGHVNNSVYYHFVDSVVNACLIERGVLDTEAGTVIGLVVETRCTYFAPLKFPEPVETGLRVTHIGRSSITYEIGIFASGAETTSALATFVHVYVNREANLPVALPPELKTVAESLLSDD